MKKELDNIEEIEPKNEEEAMETETKQKFGSKVVGWGKKHGKKIVTGVAVAAVGLLGYALGQKNAGEGCGEFEDESDFIDTDFEEVTEE